MIKHILIPVDFSDTAEAAAEFGCKLASQLVAEVTLLHVYPPPIVPNPGAMYFPAAEEFSALGDRARAELDALARRLARFGQPIECVASLGTPADTIRKVVEERHVDLVVMGTHGRRGIARAVLGSVAERVLRIAPCAVMTVRRENAQPSFAAAP
jgi:nucleotide-binding universal stress UspA family protein